MPSDSLILFDIDGTLLRGAGPHHKDALIEAIRRITGIACSFEGIDTSGQLDRDLIRTLLASSRLSQRTIQRALARIMHEAQLCYQQSCHIDLRSKVLPGVVHALDELQRRQIPLALVTGNLTAIAWRKLELAGLRGYFSFGAFAEQGRTRARLAQVAAWQAKRQGLVTRRCTVSLIGDHANDIAAAKANGFKAIAVATGLMPLDELRLHSPDLLLQDLTDLPFDLLFLSENTHQISSGCRNKRPHSTQSGSGLALTCTWLTAMFTLAGNTATSSNTRLHAASQRVRRMSKPTPPAISAIPLI